MRNTIGSDNTASGTRALFNNNEGSENTATGLSALESNSTGSGNTAVGSEALAANINGDDNTATGLDALHNNAGGSFNTADGIDALLVSSDGSGNTAVGSFALSNIVTGSLNVAVGENAGENLTSGDSNNIDIGFDVGGVAGESNTIRIGNTDITDTFIKGISGTTVASGATVLVAANGHLGTATSSKRFKEEIKPMDKASEALFSLKPVTFRYKKQLDPARTQQFGLVAEDVEKISADLVVRDEKGVVNTVRYDQVNAMLLNEFLKEHRTVMDLKKQIAALASGLHSVRAELEISRSAPQMASLPAVALREGANNP